MTTDTLNERSQYLRQLGIYNPAEHPYDAVTFVGVGGIGSFAAFGAAKLGIPNITLIDHDTVEPHNQPNQFLGRDAIGEHKAAALARYLREDRSSGTVLDDHVVGNCNTFEKLDRGEFQGAVVSGLDSMEARAQLWKQQIKLNPRVSLYIDARLGGQSIVVYCVQPLHMGDVKAYEKTLYSDDEAEDLPCTERGVIDVGLMVSAVITRALRLHFTRKKLSPITYINQAQLTIAQGDWIE